MDQNTIQSEIGGCPKSDHAKIHVLSVFTMFSGGRWIMGGVCPYIYIYVCVCIYVCICTYAYIYVYVHMYVCIYIYTHI